MGGIFKLDLPMWDYQALSSGFVIFMGIFLAVVASLLTTLGINVQKLSLCDEANADLSPWTQRKWVFGFVLVVTGSLLDFVAFGLAPQSLLAPLAALSLIWNLMIAAQLHGEIYTKRDVIAAVFVFLGCGVSVVAGSHEEKSYDLDALLQLFGEARMTAYSACVIMLVVGFYVSAKMLEKHVAEYEMTHANTSDDHLEKCKTVSAVCYAGIGGVVGGNSILAAKCVMELLKNAAHGDWGVFLHIETYMLIVLMLAFLLTQITFLNEGLKRFDALKIVPLYQSMWIISGTCGGLIFWNEIDDMTASDMNIFILGLFLTLFGLFVLTTKGKTPHADDEQGEYSQVNKRGSFSSSEGDVETGGLQLLMTTGESSDACAIRTPSSDVSSSSSTSTDSSVNAFKTM